MDAVRKAVVGLIIYKEELKSHQKDLKFEEETTTKVKLSNTK